MIKICPLTKELCKDACELERKYLSTANSEKQLLEIFENENYCYVTALENQELIGVGCVICATEDCAEILTVAVEEKMRGRGTGFEIVSGLEVFCKSKNAMRIFLEVEDGNSPAISLYKKCGFSESGRRKGFYRTKDGIKDAIIMVKNL